ncbi:MAG: hypothetical protein HFJ27_00775 [Clostridia bacterium]|nr:hypothetical protein [Clostridia bacterium]
MTVKIELARQTDELFLFIGETHRLCEESKSFAFTCIRGCKLFLKTCKGLQRDAYACISSREEAEPIVTTLNYAVALQANLQISLDHKILYFDITANRIDKIRKFADSLKISYDF